MPDRGNAICLCPEVAFSTKSFNIFLPNYNMHIFSLLFI
jgi:hypothetical protein